MISSVRGLVLSAVGSTAVLEVGGVGLAVQVTPNTALSLRHGTEARLLTILLVREDSLTLYGFLTADELSVFELLVGVTGVGPKSALGVLAVLTPNQVAQAVAGEDDAVFRKVSGIGPKTAKLIILSLTGKVVVSAVEGQARTRRPAPASPSGNVQAALIGLGWSERVAEEAVRETLAESAEPDQIGVAALLRLVLARLGPAHQASEDRP